MIRNADARRAFELLDLVHAIHSFFVTNFATNRKPSGLGVLIGFRSELLHSNPWRDRNLGFAARTENT
jgi:hypothetical protein